MNSRKFRMLLKSEFHFPHQSSEKCHGHIEHDPLKGKNNSRNENSIPGIFTLETIFKGYSYKVHQVLDNQCCQLHTQAHNRRKDAEKAKTLQMPDFEIIKPYDEILFRRDDKNNILPCSSKTLVKIECSIFATER